MYIFLITTLIIITITLVIVKNKSKIKREFIRFQLKQRERQRLKFSYDDEHQKQTIRMIEKLLREKESRLYHATDTDNYYIEFGDIYGIFNSKMASIVNGKFNNSVLIYEALYHNLQEKYKARLTSDVRACEKRIDAKVDNIIHFINDDIHANIN